MQSDDRRHESPPCGRLGDDDGIDPRDLFDNRERKRDLRKARQLCKQVARTLDFVLSGEIDDDLLRNLYVASVDPAPNASRLAVVLQPYGREEIDPIAVQQRLGELYGRLRAEVGRSIHRKRVPELVFQIALEPGDHR